MAERSLAGLHGSRFLVTIIALLMLAGACEMFDAVDFGSNPEAMPETADPLRSSPPRLPNSTVSPGATRQVLVPDACWLFSAGEYPEVTLGYNRYVLNSVLDTSFDAPGEPVFQNLNDCRWSKPLGFEDRTEYTLRITSWSAEMEKAILRSEWEANPDLRVDLEPYFDEPIPDHWSDGRLPAWFESGSSTYPTSMEFPDGSISVAAYANFYFETPAETGQLWITLHPTGTSRQSPK